MNRLSFSSVKTCWSALCAVRQIHTTQAVFKKHFPVITWPGYPQPILGRTSWPGDPKKFITYNNIVYPPTEDGEPKRPGEYCYQKTNILFSPKRMWHVLVAIRGLSIDEAKIQLGLADKTGAAIALEALDEAQKEAANQGCEYLSNLWVENATCGRAPIIKGMRNHAKNRMGKLHFRYVHIFLRLREGKPPKHYYTPEKTGGELARDYVRRFRTYRITHSL